MIRAAPRRTFKRLHYVYFPDEYQILSRFKHICLSVCQILNQFAHVHMLHLPACSYVRLSSVRPSICPHAHLCGVCL